MSACPLLLISPETVQLVWTAPRSRHRRLNLLQLVFVLLRELGRAAADPLVYVRAIGVALFQWQAFNSGLPGLWYGEESGEVMPS